VYGLLFVVLLLSLFNISIKEALTTLSLIAAAVVLITKDYIANLINGMYLTFARVVSVGDQVAIDGNKGKILDITLTNVHLLNEDDDIVYIPNNKVFSSEIINYTRRELKKSNIDFEVDPLVVFDIEALENKLVDALKPLEKDIVPGSYNLKTNGLKRDCIHLKFQYILEEPLNKEMDKKVKKYLTRELLKILHKEMEDF
jgi:small-conductance mechanosensitive channel